MRRLCHAHRPGAEKNEEWRPSNVALYPFPLRCIVACHCHSIHSFTVQSHVWTTSIDQLVLTSIRPARATISIGRRAPSAAPHWMRRAARLCVASPTLYFVGQRPDTKGAPPLYLTPLPK